MFLKNRHCTWIFVLSLMLSLLAFSGCSFGGGTDPETITPVSDTPNIPSYPIYNPGKAATDLTDNLGNGATVSGSTVSITGPVTLPSGTKTIDTGEIFAV